LVLKPLQVESRAHLSEQSCCGEDDDIVSLAVSIAHNSGPFFILIDFLYDIICTDCRPADVTGIYTPTTTSRIIGTSLKFIFALCLDNIYKQEIRAIAGRTARCRCKFRYVANFTINGIVRFLCNRQKDRRTDGRHTNHNHDLRSIGR